MLRKLMCKIIQKKTYDILAKKHTLFILFIGLILVILSVLHFGETLLEWSQEKYAVVFSPYSNNILGKNYRNMLCQYVPIDVVYTWVNGTDPKFLSGLAKAKEEYGFLESHMNCTFSNCVLSHMVLVRPSLPSFITLSDFEEIDPIFQHISKSFLVSLHKENVTVLEFPEIIMAQNVAKKHVLSLEGVNYTLAPAYLTDAWDSVETVPLSNMLLLQQLSNGFSPKDVMKKFSLYDLPLSQVFLHNKKSLAVLQFPNSSLANTALKLTNVTFNNKVTLISACYLVVERPSEHEDISASRFTDNEELRYSLRSLEKHAPWVRHVYIVTNGQIPYWLNLDSPLVSIVTHEEIFLNNSHLPTFSSPAIECHLHRIPNLSRKFLYLNDDVMFGNDVWPEDFYTHTKGQKVYLSWPVPNCADGCPASWIRDGYCDKPCNTSQCQWDGGDCIGDISLMSFHQLSLLPTRFFPLMETKDYCHSECADTWLADRYCDKPCNVRECGFDAGDCGVKNFYHLPQLFLTEDKENYYLPQGEYVGYFNLTQFLNSSFELDKGFWVESPTVRTLAISLKHSIISIVLYKNHSATNITLCLTGELNKEPYEKKIYLHVSTTLLPKTGDNGVDILKPSSSVENFTFEEFENDMKAPHINSKLLSDSYFFASRSPESTIAKAPEAEKLQNLDPGISFKKSLITDLFIHNVTESKLLRNEMDSLPSNPLKNVGKEEISHATQRHLLDTFGESLRHVNQLFNTEFGLEARKVPAHIAHFVDREVMKRLTEKFDEAFEVTSSHRIRSSTDMQFAFSYYYYMMNEMQKIEISEIFDMFDTDYSGIWSEREMRTVQARLHDLPLDGTSIIAFERMLINCSVNQSNIETDVDKKEQYYNSQMPQVSHKLVMNCPVVANMLLEQFGHRKKNIHEILGEEEVAFKMLHNNLSQVLSQIDDLRKHPKKFVCLNDNMKHGTHDADVIRAVVVDFYESLFPTRSQFELAPEYRNRFLNVRDLQQWRKMRNVVRFFTYGSLALLVLFSFFSFWNTEIRRQPRQHRQLKESQRV